MHARRKGPHASSRAWSCANRGGRPLGTAPPDGSLQPRQQGRRVLLGRSDGIADALPIGIAIAPRASVLPQRVRIAIAARGKGEERRRQQ